MKGRRFAEYRDAGHPAGTARAHNHQGADELVVCDIDASKQGRGPDLAAVGSVADNCFVPLTVFGGVRTIDTALACFDVGADKLGLTTSAVEEPALIERLAHRFGAQAVVVGIDVLRTADGGLGLYDHRCRGAVAGRDPLDWARECVARGAGEIRLLSVDREGGLAGYDLELLTVFRETVDVPIVLEGGAGSLEHIEAAYRAGVDGAAVGAMLVFTDANLVKIKQHLRSNACSVRPS